MVLLWGSTKIPEARQRPISFSLFSVYCVLDNRVLRKIFWSKRDEVTRKCRKQNNEELNDLYCSPILFGWYNLEEYGATGRATRSLRKNLEAVPGKHSIDSLQKTAILGTSHKIRKVLQCEAWSLSGGNHRWFKRSTRKKRPVTRDIHIV